MQTRLSAAVQCSSVVVDVARFDLDRPGGGRRSEHPEGHLDLRGRPDEVVAEDLRGSVHADDLDELADGRTLELDRRGADGIGVLGGIGGVGHG